jgi:hypothetical protein
LLSLSRLENIKDRTIRHLQRRLTASEKLVSREAAKQMILRGAVKPESPLMAKSVELSPVSNLPLSLTAFDWQVRK